MPENNAIAGLRVLIAELEQRIVDQGKELIALRDQRDKLLETEKTARALFRE